MFGLGELDMLGELETFSDIFCKNAVIDTPNVPLISKEYEESCFPIATFPT